MVQEHTHKHINENPDSIEVGTPSKGGTIKIYGNYDNPEAFKLKVDNAVRVREHTNNKLNGGN